MRLRLVQPTFQLRQDRQALFLPASQSLLITGILQFTFDALQLVDQCPRHICAPGFALGLHLLSFNKLATGMRHARQSLNIISRCNAKAL